MASSEDLVLDLDSALSSEAHIQHGHPPLVDPKVKYYMKWDEWAESSRIHHQKHRLKQWEILIRPKIEYYCQLDEEHLAGVSE